MNRKLLVVIPVVLLALIASAMIATAAQPKGGPQNAPALGNTGSQAQSPSPDAPLAAVGTGFTYQGRLTDGGSPASGQYDLQFTLYDTPTAGNQVGTAITL